MKALIVDDETDVRDSIRLLVDWKAYGIGEVLEAADGVQAIELIRGERPEIVFTDVKMPNAGGMELLEWIEAECPESKRIVVSGFDDYEYIRQTMKRGGLDYLLKPINRGELLETLGRAVDEWRREEEDRRLRAQKNVEINRTKPVYWDKQLSAVVSRPGYARSVLSDLQAGFGWSGARRCLAAIVPTDPLPRVILRKFGRNLDLLYFLMTNVCNEVLGSTAAGYAFKHADPSLGIVVLFVDPPGDPRGTLAAMSDALAEVLGARFRFACAERAAEFPDGIADSFEEAVRATRSLSFAEPASSVPRPGTEAPASDKQVVLADYATVLSVAVFGGDGRRIEAAVDRWIRAVGELPAITLENLQYWRYEFELLLHRLLQEGGLADGGADASLPQSLYPIDAEGRLSLEEWRREWIGVLSRIAERLKEAKPKERSAVQEIKRYIDLNYKKNLSLQELADRFFVSREHASRRFKQEFGLSPSEYIEKVRIDNAKTLLARTHDSIAAVAEKVGYPDSRYFSRIFNRQTGMTPRDYRKKPGDVR